MGLSIHSCVQQLKCKNLDKPEIDVNVLQDSLVYLVCQFLVLRSKQPLGLQLHTLCPEKTSPTFLTVT